MLHPRLLLTAPLLVLVACGSAATGSTPGAPPDSEAAATTVAPDTDNDPPATTDSVATTATTVTTVTTAGDQPTEPGDTMVGQAARSVLEQIRDLSSDTSDIEAATGAPSDCVFGDLGIAGPIGWLAEGDGTLICLYGSDADMLVVGATVGDLPFSEVIGANATDRSSIELADGVLEAGCGDQTCAAVWTTDDLRVLTAGHSDAIAAGNTVIEHRVSILNGVVAFDIGALAAGQ